MSHVQRIGLIVSHSLAYCRGVLRGIKEYAQTRPQWVLLPVAPNPRSIHSLAALQPTGVIAHLFAEAVAKAVDSLGTPVVNVSGAMRMPPVPRVGIDDRKCGEAAALHLIDRGFRHFAFVGHWDHYYSVERETGFRDALTETREAVESFHVARGQPFEPIGHIWSLDPNLHRWLTRLPRPVGVFAPNDIWGMQLTEACRQTGLRVPEDVAIVGVDNDDLLCELARPSLSSIKIPSERVGWEAASMLDRILSRDRVPQEPLLLPPTGVVPRRSSDVLAISDDDVAKAVRFIRDEAHRPLRVRDVLEKVPVSRRSLERRFRSVLGRSLLDEIRRVHLDRACALLSDSELPMHLVAQRAGFSDAKQLSVAFRQCLGQTPTEFRRLTRGHSGRWGKEST